MDILKDIISRNSDLDLLHPGTGEAIGLVLELRPFHDERCKKVQRSITNRRQKLAARGKTFTAEEIEENMIELQSSVIDGWKIKKGLTFDGAELTFNPVNVRKLLALDWVRDQITERLDDITRFFQNSATN